MSTLRVALAQILSGSDPQENLESVATQVAEVATHGAQLVIFPEATMRRFGLPLAEIAEPVDGPWAQQLRKIAEHHQIVIIAGMFTPSGDGRVRNTLRAVGPNVDAHYDKIHLFDAFGFRESDTVAAGTEPVMITVGETKVGLTTCYDVRFPGLYVKLAELAADVICVAASWGAGAGKVQQWQLLTQARALDSTAYVVAAGQADPAAAGLRSERSEQFSPVLDGTAPTGVGYSAVISPRGEVLRSLGAETGLLLANLDLDEVAKTRAAIPVLANRRL
jgi:deaminated glutathione amidase